MMRPSLLATMALLMLALASASCRGKISKDPPLHPVLDMDFQAKLKAQSKSDFAGWTDHRGMRPPVKGAVARGSLRRFDPDPKVAGLYPKEDADFKSLKNPLPRSREVVQRGRTRFEINCAICHGTTGRGNGPVGLRYPVQPPSFLSKQLHAQPQPGKDDRLDERVQGLSDGELFQTITYGKGTMMPYAHQVTAYDRWCIVHYIRVLQLRVKE